MDVPKDSAARLDAGLHWQTSTGGLVKPRHPGTQTAALIHGGKTGGRAVCPGPQTPRFRQMNGGRQAWKPGTRQLSAEGRAGQGAERQPRAVSGPRALRPARPPPPPAGAPGAPDPPCRDRAPAGPGARGRTARRGRGWGPRATKGGRRGDSGPGGTPTRGAPRPPTASRLPGPTAAPAHQAEPLDPRPRPHLLGRLGAGGWRGTPAGEATAGGEGNSWRGRSGVQGPTGRALGLSGANGVTLHPGSGGGAGHAPRTAFVTLLLRERGGVRTTHGTRHAPSRRGGWVPAVGERGQRRESRDRLLGPPRFPRDLRESRESPPPITAKGWRRTALLPLTAPSIPLSQLAVPLFDDQLGSLCAIEE